MSVAMTQFGVFGRFWAVLGGLGRFLAVSKMGANEGAHLETLTFSKISFLPTDAKFPECVGAFPCHFQSVQASRKKVVLTKTGILKFDLNTASITQKRKAVAKKSWDTLEDLRKT